MILGTALVAGHYYQIMHESLRSTKVVKMVLVIMDLWLILGLRNKNLLAFTKKNALGLVSGFADAIVQVVLFLFIRRLSLSV